MRSRRRRNSLQILAPNTLATLAPQQMLGFDYRNLNRPPREPPLDQLAACAARRCAASGFSAAPPDVKSKVETVSQA